ncbi:peptidylprolyl isomerase [Arcticibacter tournemirensis]|uniref:peptidylprolyl isomerase n=1 Tax=Arcticibacter tournemirensis TaxID=699437 RepID=A0A4Q0MED1_9SPHI|nr:peptidylprolyl isomerase [Arcticibacter tournemirensis]RXF71788.1 peptidylprolyl isomerase [Arcticibacter tournemirensis]
MYYKRPFAFKPILILFLSFVLGSSFAANRKETGIFDFLKKPGNQYVLIKTDKGECIVRLYNETPKHRDNFIKLVKKGFYNGTLFHRVIKSFMIQGGDPDSKHAKPAQLLGEGDLGYQIPAEFNPGIFHKKGVIAAARDDNAAKSSSASQFYLVQGKVYTDEELNVVEEKRLKGRKIPPAQRQIYKTIGGTPFLDQNYTVYGEIVKGIEMVDSVASVPTDGNDRPLSDISIQMRLLKRKEIKKLEKELAQENFRKKLIM